MTARSAARVAAPRAAACSRSRTDSRRGRRNGWWLSARASSSRSSASRISRSVSAPASLIASTSASRLRPGRAASSSSARRIARGVRSSCPASATNPRSRWRPLQAGEQRVDGGAQCRDLVAGGGDTEAPVEVAVADLRGLAPHPLDGPQRRPGQQPRADPGQQHRYRRPEHQGQPDPLDGHVGDHGPGSHGHDDRGPGARRGRGQDAGAVRTDLRGERRLATEGLPVPLGRPWRPGCAARVGCDGAARGAVIPPGV